MTPHIEAKKEDIADIVLMPGDPLRAKLFAETYLTDIKLVNRVRNMFAYTGYYKGKRVTIMGSGMGIPSMGIYAYELYKFYDVKTIIRIGSCGSFTEDINIYDVILTEEAYTTSTFAMNMNSDDCNLVAATKSVNDVIKATAKEMKMPLVVGTTMTADCFDYYIDDWRNALSRVPEGINIKNAEMEAFALFYTAKVLNKKAACITTVVDSHYHEVLINAEEREKFLSAMVKLALESILNLGE